MAAPVSNLRNENLIKENVPVIFLERPWTVLALAWNDKSVKFGQKLKLLARAIIVLFRSIFTRELTMHAGIFLKESDGKIYRYHMTGTKALKQEVTRHYLHGCYWLIPNDAKIGKQAKISKNIEENVLTDEQAAHQAYQEVNAFIQEACLPPSCKFSNADLLQMPFYRKRVVIDSQSYYQQYKDHKRFKISDKKKPTFICSEFVATAWIRGGIQVAPENFKIDKIFMWNIQSHARKDGLFSLHKT